MAFTGVVARRRASTGSWNPLSGGALNDLPPDVWVCTAEAGVKLYISDSLDCAPIQDVKMGTEICATREGKWLREKRSGLYAPYVDGAGHHNFKNHRLLMLERTASGRSDGDAPSRATSDGTVTSARTKSTSAESRSPLNRRNSFRWVDAAGEAHRLEGSDDAVRDLTLQPEVWVCIADHYVPYSASPSHDDAVWGKDCKMGSKVNAVREGDWLRVMDVKTVFNAASIGRRSFKAATKIVLEDTGLFLPMVGHAGTALFKNHKLALLSEVAQPLAAKEAPESAATDETKCVLM